MIFRQLFHAGSGTYTYLLGCEETRKSMMGNLKLDNPKWMDVAVPANLACGKTA